MTSLLTNATLPISSILDINPVWIRRELTQLEDLKTSLRDHGMLLPVLLTRDWEMVDGARRVVAAHQLGWTDVPVIIEPEWDMVMTYFKEAKRRAGLGQAVPMTWLELAELWAEPVTRLYATERRQRGLKTRRLHKSGVEVDEPEYPTTSTAFSRDVRAMFGFTDSDIKSLRDIRSALNRIATTPPASRGKLRLAEATKLVDVMNQHALAIDRDPCTTHGASFMRHLLHAVAGNRTTMAEAEAEVKRFMERHRVRREPKPPSKQRTIHQRLEKPDTTTPAGRLVSMLITVATEAEYFDFELSPPTPEQAEVLADLVLRCSFKTNKFKRQLQAIADPTNNPTDSKEQGE